MKNTSSGSQLRNHNHIHSSSVHSFTEWRLAKKLQSSRHRCCSAPRVHSTSDETIYEYETETNRRKQPSNSVSNSVSVFVIKRRKTEREREQKTHKAYSGVGSTDVVRTTDVNIAHGIHAPSRSTLQR